MVLFVTRQVALVKHPVQGLSRRSSQKKKIVPKHVPWADRRVPKYSALPGTVARLRRVTIERLSGDIGDLARARTIRLEADRRATMSDRLARMHSLCRQMSAIKGAAAAR
jgi:hypothetical protein